MSRWWIKQQQNSPSPASHRAGEGSRYPTSHGSYYGGWSDWYTQRDWFTFSYFSYYHSTGYAITGIGYLEESDLAIASRGIQAGLSNLPPALQGAIQRAFEEGWTPSTEEAVELYSLLYKIYPTLRQYEEFLSSLRHLDVEKAETRLAAYLALKSLLESPMLGGIKESTNLRQRASAIMAMVMWPQFVELINNIKQLLRKVGKPTQLTPDAISSIQRSAALEGDWLLMKTMSQLNDPQSGIGQFLSDLTNTEDLFSSQQQGDDREGSGGRDADKSSQGGHSVASWMGLLKLLQSQDIFTLFGRIRRHMGSRRSESVWERHQRMTRSLEYVRAALPMYHALPRDVRELRLLDGYIARLVSKKSNRVGGPVIVIVDHSGSMDGPAYQFAIGLAMATLYHALKAGYPGMYLAFRVSVFFKATLRTPDDLLELLAKVPVVGGGTNISSALNEGAHIAQQFLSQGGDIVIITDANDTVNLINGLSKLDAVLKQGVRLWTFYVNPVDLREHGKSNSAANAFRVALNDTFYYHAPFRWQMSSAPAELRNTPERFRDLIALFQNELSALQDTKGVSPDYLLGEMYRKYLEFARNLKSELLQTIEEFRQANGCLSTPGYWALLAASQELFVVPAIQSDSLQQMMEVIDTMVPLWWSQFVGTEGV